MKVIKKKIGEETRRQADTTRERRPETASVN